MYYTLQFIKAAKGYKFFDLFYFKNKFLFYFNITYPLCLISTKVNTASKPITILNQKFNKHESPVLLHKKKTINNQNIQTSSKKLAGE